MSHPHNTHRQHKVEHRRVHHITHGMAHGGHIHSDEGSDMALIRRTVKKSALRAAGGRVVHRADKPRRTKGGRVNHEVKEQVGHDDLDPREGASDDKRSMHRARGGRAKHKGHTTVNVMVSPHSAPSPGAAPPVAPPPIAQAGAAPPIRPPMAPPGVGGMPPPGAPPPGLPMRPGMPPPGMPLRARGGKVTDGPAYQEGKRARPVDHGPGKQDTPDIGRGKVITYKKGGRVRRADGGSTGDDAIYRPAPDDTGDDIYDSSGKGSDPRVKGLTPKKRGGRTHRAAGGRIYAPSGKSKHSGGNEAHQGIAQKYGGGDYSQNKPKTWQPPYAGGRGGKARLIKSKHVAGLS